MHAKSSVGCNPRIVDAVGNPPSRHTNGSIHLRTSVYAGKTFRLWFRRVALALFCGAGTSASLLAEANGSADATTATAPSAVTMQIGLPYFTGFETSEGFALGSLAGQAGWAAPGQVDITTALSSSGQSSVLLAPAQPPALAAHAFPPYTGESVVFLDVFARPAAGATPADSILFETETARVALVRSSAAGELHVFSGDGLGGGVWQPTGFTIALTTTGEATAWLRLTLREDFSAKRWDVYVNGHLVAHGLGFRDNTQTLFRRFTLSGHSTSLSAFDDFYIGFDNPLFVDADKDGLDDLWQAAYKPSLSASDRTAAPETGGLISIRENLRGTVPRGDGISEGGGIQHGQNAGANNATIDHESMRNEGESQLGDNPAQAAAPDSTGAVGLRVYRPRN